MKKKSKITNPVPKFSKESLRAFFDNSLDVIMRFDRQKRHLFVSTFIEKQTGIPPAEFIGKTHEEMGFPEHLSKLWEDAIEKVFITGKPNRIEFELPNNVWIDWLLVPEYSKNGDTEFVITTARDITEMKKAEKEIVRLNSELENRVKERTMQLESANKALREKIAEMNNIENALAENEKRYKTLFDLSPSGIMLNSMEGVVQDFNQAVLDSCGYEREELVNQHVSLLAHPQCRGSIDSHINILKNGENLHHVVKNIKKDGTTYYIELYETKITLPGGEDGILCISNDITGKVRAEKKLKASEERLRTLINAMPDIVYFKNGEGQWLEANDAVLSFFELTEVNYVGLKDSELAEYTPFYSNIFLANEIADNILWELRSILKGELVVPLRDGLSKTFEIIKVPLYHRNGSKKGLVVLGRDVTERKNTELELRKAKEEAIKSDKLKTEFLAQMSHEIRSPINIILSFSTLLKEELKGKIPEELEMSFDSIDVGGKRIIRTIDQILNMSEIQTGSFEIKVCEIDLVNDILKNCVKEFQTPARIKSLQLNFHNSAGYPKIIADQYSLGQIFNNLIDNAIKYTPKGKIDINLFRQDGSIIAEIQDTGIGISDEYLPNLFKPFSQEESGYTRRYEGNGLGLALVKNYVEINNAEIEVESKKGEGSLFRVIFKNFQESPTES